MEFFQTYNQSAQKYFGELNKPRDLMDVWAMQVVK
jgi:hypothetical protein